MTPEHFFESFVIENQSEFHTNPGSLRCAFNAAISASHCADHYFSYYTKNHADLVASYGDDIGSFIEHLSTETNGAFRDVRSIANAYKHLYTKVGRNTAPDVDVASCGAIFEIELHNDPNLTAIREDCQVSTTTEVLQRVVVFTRRDGSDSEFKPVLDAAVDYLQKLIFGS